MIKHSSHCMDVCCEGCPTVNTISAEIELGVAALELGVLRERERIIALLEAHVSDLDLEWFEMKWSDMVALIRGENK
jgi:hypothetical protein